MWTTVWSQLQELRSIHIKSVCVILIKAALTEPSSNELTFPLCHVWSRWLAIVCKCFLCAFKKLLATLTLSACWEWSASTCFWLFDQSDKSTVVVYTLVPTRCADHILFACGPLPAFFFHPTHTFWAPSSKPQEQRRASLWRTIFPVLFFFCFTVLLVKALLTAGWDAPLLF